VFGDIKNYGIGLKFDQGLKSKKCEFELVYVILVIFRLKYRYKVFDDNFKPI